MRPSQVIGKVAATMAATVMDDTDDDLARKAAASDVVAFRRLYERHFATVFRIVAAWPSITREQAEDIVQETWLRAFRSPPQFQPGKYVAWLLAIAANVRTDELRRQRSTADIADQALTGPERHQPEHIMAEWDDHRQLRECLSRLAAEFADVVRRWMHGESYQDISAALSIPIQTVGSRLNRAKEKLADCLGVRSA
ncbi:MAG: sigma-70 family RNA polymerase sigma factor [Planctomycetaceae bacterium]|nr:sigma-70 family RNA polymerase sigma factor [Planctomycetaceae bacterium]